MSTFMRLGASGCHEILDLILYMFRGKQHLLQRSV